MSDDLVTEYIPCYACEKPVPDYDNMLEVEFDGGYGMFVESVHFLLMHDFWKSLRSKLQREYYDEWVSTLKSEANTVDELNALHPNAVDITIPPMPLPEGAVESFRKYVNTNHPFKAMLCHECAHAACEALPWMKKLLNPHGSHSHRTSYVAEHPDHWGWDYDHRAGA